MARAVLQIVEEYQKARVTFVQAVADLASKPHNIDSLYNAGIMGLLRPLLLDTVSSIQQSAAIALGRLANYSDELAECVVTHEILPQLVYSLSEQNKFYRKAAAFVLRAVSKHSPQLAQAVVDAGALESLATCLEEFDPSVREAAAWALGYVARHTKELAQAVVDSRAVPLLVLCYQESEVSLKKVAASALSDISKHSPDLAQSVIDAGAVALLAKDLTPMTEMDLKKQVCSCLSQIAKHSVEHAETVMGVDIFPDILTCLKKDINTECVRKNAATCIREIARHSPNMARLIVNAGGVKAMVEYIGEVRGNSRLPGIMSLGYIAAFSDQLAHEVIVSKAVLPLKDALMQEPEDHIKAAAAWSLGQIGRHSADHSRALAEADVLRRLLAVYMHQDSSEDLITKAKRALKSVIQKCQHMPSLEPLLQEAPPNILKYVVQQIVVVLRNDPAAKKAFAYSGGLQKIQEVQADSGSKLHDCVNEINSLYPADIVQYYSPNFEETLLARIRDSVNQK